MMPKNNGYPENVTVLYALENVNKNNPEPVDMDEFYRAVNLEMVSGYCWNKINEKLKAYPVYSWLCTDTQVGFYAVYLGDELVAQTQQDGRKCDVTIEFVSQSAALKVQSFLLACMYEESIPFPILSDDELNSPLLTLTSVRFAKQQLISEGFFKGRSCKLIKRVEFNSNESQMTMTGLGVQFNDTGEINVIPCSEFKTLINVDLSLATITP